MAWTAINKKGEILNTFIAQENNSDLSNAQAEDWTCLACDGAVNLVSVGSVYVRAHFRHLPDSRCYLNKSALHEQAQVDLYHLLKADYPDCVIDIEHYIPPTIDNKKTFVDVAVIDINGRVIEAHEVQLSRQSDEEFTYRTSRYNQMGIGVIWWLNGNSNTNWNAKDAIIRAGGCYGTLTISEESKVLGARKNENGQIA